MIFRLPKPVRSYFYTRPKFYVFQNRDGFIVKSMLSCCSVMNLLAEIYSQEEMIPKMFGGLTAKEKQEFDLNEEVNVDDHAGGSFSQENPYMLSTLAPRLWPFMRHSITSVRHSAMRTLVNLFLFWTCWSFTDVSCFTFLLFNFFSSLLELP